MNNIDDNIGIHLPYDQIFSYVMHNTSIIFITHDEHFDKARLARGVTLLIVGSIMCSAGAAACAVGATICTVGPIMSIVD